MSVDTVSKLIAASAIAATLSLPAFADKTTHDLGICDVDDVQCREAEGDIRDVPEPSFLALMALGVVGVGVAASRRRKSDPAD